MKKIEVKEALFTNALTEVPESGLMPDVCLPVPPAEEAAAFGRKLKFGFSDDPDFQKANFHKVDDVCGFFDLYAGIANNKLFFSTKKQPENNETLEADCTITSQKLDDTVETWQAGVPHLGYKIVAFEYREQFLKRNGVWRRLDWTPLANIEIQSKTPNFSTRRFETNYYTIYIIVDGEQIAFYTTTATYDELFPSGKEPLARWPFSFYLSRNRTKKGNEFYNDNYYSDGLFEPTRLCPLPWQMKNEEVEAEEESSSFGYVVDGQFYTVPVPRIAPRYMSSGDPSTVGTDLVFAEHSAVYEKSALDGTVYEETKLDADEVRKLIDDHLLPRLNNECSIDPAFCEAQKKTFFNFLRSNCQEGYSPTYAFKPLFEFHFDETENRWPVWFIAWGANAQTALLTSSTAFRYNDYSKANIMYPGYNPNGKNPVYFDPDDKDGEDKDDEDGGGGEGGDDGEGGGGNEDAFLTLDDGYFYEAGNGVKITKEWLPASKPGAAPGWKFFIHVYGIPCSGQLAANVEFTASTTNASGTYDYPEAEAFGLSMFYGITSDGSAIKVSWKSSFLGGDNLPKNASLSATSIIAYTSSANFDDDVIASSATPPAAFLNVVNAVKTRQFTKRGTYKYQDEFTTSLHTGRFEKKFSVYSLSVNRYIVEEYIKNYVLRNLPDCTVSVSPSEIHGTSDGIEGPVVKADKCSISCPERVPDVTLTGPFKPTIITEFENINPNSHNIAVSGSASWNSVNGIPTRHGSISGNFEITIEQKT